MLTRNCDECGKEYQTKLSYVKRGQGLYCGRSCAALANNRKRKPSGEVVNCFFCGKQIYRIKRDIAKSKTGKFFCDRECRGKSETIGTQRIKNMGSQRRAHLARKADLLEEHGVKCFVVGCQLDLKGDRRFVDLHHYDHPLDHDKTVLLCPYHHRLADFGHRLNLL